jgi:Domain of unknown function (DUF6473)
MRSYQDEDRHLLDYGLAVVPGLEEWGASFRGPPPRRPGFVAFLGAAQTFGRLCAHPFPALIAERLDVEVLNLGHGGAGPEFYLRTDLLKAVPGAAVAVVQVMSARSQSTEHFRSDEGLMAGRRLRDGRAMVAEEFFEDLCRETPEQIPPVISAFQSAYVQTMQQLLIALRPLPTILFWFSARPPGPTSRTGTAREVLGTFPQLVDREMIEAIRPYASDYVECVGSAGLPRRIIAEDGRASSFVLDYRLDRPEQYTIETDSYYPSPEMHADAADRLTGPIKALIQDAHPRSPDRPARTAAAQDGQL